MATIPTISQPVMLLQHQEKSNGWGHGRGLTCGIVKSQLECADSQLRSSWSCLFQIGHEGPSILPSPWLKAFKLIFKLCSRQLLPLMAAKEVPIAIRGVRYGETFFCCCLQSRLGSELLTACIFLLPTFQNFRPAHLKREVCKQQ